MKTPPPGKQRHSLIPSQSTRNTVADPNTSLYELDSELAEVEMRLHESGGVLDDETEELLDNLLDQRGAKIEGYVAVIRNFEARAAAVESELKRLKGRKSAAESSAKRLKDKLAASMDAFGEDVYETDLATIRLQQHHTRPVRLDVDKDELPGRFLKTRVSADKTALREALESGDLEAADVAHLGEASIFARIY